MQVLHVALLHLYSIIDGSDDVFAFGLVLLPQDAKQEYPSFDETWFLFRNKGKSL